MPAVPPGPSSRARTCPRSHTTAAMLRIARFIATHKSWRLGGACFRYRFWDSPAQADTTLSA